MPRRSSRHPYTGVVISEPLALLVAFTVVGVLGLVLRWVFKPSHPRVAGTGLIDATEAARAGTLGMLTVAVAAQPRARGLQLRNTLANAGVRSSLSRRQDGRVDLLVFRDDADRARQLLQ